MSIIMPNNCLKTPKKANIKYNENIKDIQSELLADKLSAVGFCLTVSNMGIESEIYEEDSFFRLEGSNNDIIKHEINIRIDDLFLRHPMYFLTEFRVYERHRNGVLHSHHIFLVPSVFRDDVIELLIKRYGVDSVTHEKLNLGYLCKKWANDKYMKGEYPSSDYSDYIHEGMYNTEKVFSIQKVKELHVFKNKILSILPNEYDENCDKWINYFKSFFKRFKNQEKDLEKLKQSVESVDLETENISVCFDFYNEIIDYKDIKSDTNFKEAEKLQRLYQDEIYKRQREYQAFNSDIVGSTELKETQRQDDEKDEVELEHHNNQRLLDELKREKEREKIRYENNKEIKRITDLFSKAEKEYSKRYRKEHLYYTIDLCVKHPKTGRRSVVKVYWGTLKGSFQSIENDKKRRESYRKYIQRVAKEKGFYTAIKELRRFSKDNRKYDKKNKDTLKNTLMAFLHDDWDICYEKYKKEKIQTDKEITKPPTPPPKKELDLTNDDDYMEFLSKCLGGFGGFI